MTEQVFCGLCKQTIKELEPPEIEYQGGWYDVHTKCKDQWDSFHQPTTTTEPLYKTMYGKYAGKLLDDFLRRSMEGNLIIMTPRQHGKTHARKEFQKYYNNESRIISLPATGDTDSIVRGYSADLLEVNEIAFVPKKKPNKRSPIKRKTMFDKVKGNDEFIQKQRNKQRKMSQLRYS